MTSQALKQDVSRRSFMKWSGVAGGSAALVATATHLGMPSAHKAAAATDGMEGVDKTVWSACTVNCGSRCPIRLQVKDGVVVRVLTDNTGTNELGSQQVRACVRGRSQRERIYSPNRLKKPMKRKPGTKRGEEQWEEISWDQALDEIADKMKAIKEEYGNEAFYIQYGTGVLGAIMSCSWPPDSSPVARLLNVYGGYLDHYGTYSSSQISNITPYVYGSGMSSNSREDAKNATLQVMFGSNILETRMGGGSQLFVAQQTKKESGVRTIVIDPRYSQTAVALSDEWVPIRPGTDAALIAGMIHVMLEKNLHDQDFLDKYCVGFDEDTLPESAPRNSSYRAYVEGKGEDGIEKTPEWASEITGIPASKIRSLAMEIGGAEACAITQALGPQRHANGENNARSILLLAAVTGNIGIPGGGTGNDCGSQGLSFARPFTTEVSNPSNKIISVFSWFEAIENGPQMDTFNAGVGVKPESGARTMKIPVDEDGNAENTKLEVPIKALFQYGSNALVNQSGDNNRSVEILQDESKAELIVTCDIRYTVSSRYSDYLLPGTTTSEESDIHPGENSGPMGYGIVSSQAIEPLYECRNIFDICTDLADRLEVKDAFTGGMTRDEWLNATIEATREGDPDLPSYEEWKEMGLFRKETGTTVAMQDFREDPEANPLGTPSGKIEIYSERLATMADHWTFGSFHPKEKGDKLSAIPEFVETWEGAVESKENEKFPFQLIGHHYMQRTHSSYGNIGWLQEAHPQVVWVNKLDAEKKGIEDGDEVFVYNDRGTCKLPAKVTERIAPGIMSIPQGAWFDPRTDITPPEGANPDKPVDVAGSVNSLTSLHPSPLAKGNSVHTTLANIVKA